MRRCLPLRPWANRVVVSAPVSSSPSLGLGFHGGGEGNADLSPITRRSNQIAFCTSTTINISDIMDCYFLSILKMQVQTNTSTHVPFSGGAREQQVHFTPQPNQHFPSLHYILSASLYLSLPFLLVMVKPSEAEKNLAQANVTSGGAASGGARKLYVGNLHSNITEDQLR
uniref:Uncharacterized protein n=1 Tax=Zea mays TaxID=4577 RepID=A0A804R611_MAIZE